VRSGDSRMLIPFFERPFMGTIDIATIPGLSGASISGNATDSLSLWREFAISQGWVSGYIQLAPFVELNTPILDSEIVAHNAVFIFDLKHWDLNKAISRNFRHKIFEARQKDAVLVDDPTILAANLPRLYAEAVKRFEQADAFSPETLTR